MILDPHANIFGLSPALITPIAAKSIASIETYVGEVKNISPNNKAFTIDFSPLFPPDSHGVWDLKRADLINAQKQIWVHVDYSGYRNYYIKNYNHCDMSGYVIDHIMNRELARCLGYKYIRLIHVSREANSSSGAGPETESVKYQKSENPYRNDPAVISYADPCDLLKMLDQKTGGFPLDSVKHFMEWIYR